MKENKKTKNKKHYNDASTYVVKVSYGNVKLEHCINNILKAMESKVERDMNEF